MSWWRRCRCDPEQLGRIERTLQVIKQQGAWIMASMAELEAELNEINEATNQAADALSEIAADIDHLLEGGVPTGGLSEADTQVLFGRLQAAKEALQAQVALQQDIAAKHTSPAEPIDGE